MKKIIHTYILKEVLSPLFISLLVFTFILFISQILNLVELLLNKGVNSTDLLKLFLYRLPYVFLFAIPMGTLLAILIAFSRLSGDNEIVALKSSGLSLYQMLLPVVMVSVATYLITSLLAIYVVPRSNYAFKNLIFNIAKKRVDIGIKPRVFNDDLQGLVLYIDRISTGKKMEGIFIHDERGGKKPQTITAKEGTIISDPKNLSIIFRLHDGSIHLVDKGFESARTITFSTYDLSLNYENMPFQKQKVGEGKSEMSLKKLLATIKKMKLKNETYNRLVMELHMRFAVPFACIILGLIGVPLGMQTNAGRSFGVVLGLGIFFIYYAFLAAARAFGENGTLPPALCLWLPNITLGLVGIYMMVTTAHESHVKTLEKLNDFFRKLNQLSEKFFT